MRSKIKISVFSIMLLLVIIAGQLQFSGCASTSKQITPEQQKAIDDSLLQQEKLKLNINMSIAQTAFQEKLYVKAARYYNKILVADTIGEYSVAKYQNLAHCYVQLSKPDSAKMIYKMGIAEYPKHSYFYKGLGYIYRMSGDNKNAINILEKLLKLEPSNTKTMDEIADLYIAEEEFDKAKAILLELIKLEPNNSKAQERLALLLGQDGDIEAIISQQRKMVEMNPDNIYYRKDLANTYYRDAQYEKAIEQFKQIIAKNSTDIVALEMLADCYKILRKYKDAVTIYNRLIEMNPADKKNIYNLAVCYVDMGRFSQAIRQASKAIKIDKKYGLAYFAKGLTYEKAADNNIKKNGGKISFSDRLVFKLAYDQFKKAAKDIGVKSNANNHLRYLKDMIPNDEHKFMNKGVTTPKGECYNWIR